MTPGVAAEMTPSREHQWTARWPARATSCSTDCRRCGLDRQPEHAAVLLQKRAELRAAFNALGQAAWRQLRRRAMEARGDFYFSVRQRDLIRATAAAWQVATFGAGGQDSNLVSRCRPRAVSNEWSPLFFLPLSPLVSPVVTIPETARDWGGGSDSHFAAAGVTTQPIFGGSARESAASTVPQTPSVSSCSSCGFISPQAGGRPECTVLRSATESAVGPSAHGGDATGEACVGLRRGSTQDTGYEDRLAGLSLCFAGNERDTLLAVLPRMGEHLAVAEPQALRRQPDQHQGEPADGKETSSQESCARKWLCEWREASARRRCAGVHAACSRTLQCRVYLSALVLTDAAHACAPQAPARHG